MSGIPFISQCKSIFQAITGDSDGARKTQEEFVEAWTEHPFKTVGEFADGIPVVGHVKGLIHFAMGDTEAGIHSEESATRTLAVVGAAAATAASGGLAAPILAGVVSGIVADSVLTGIESARHDHFDPQGMVGVGSNIYRDISTGKDKKIGGDIFDGVVIAATDGYIGSAALKPAAPVKSTTTIFRVEGKSLIKGPNGEFKAGDNGRLMHYVGPDEIRPRERPPPMQNPEFLDPNYQQELEPLLPVRTRRRGAGADPTMAEFGRVGLQDDLLQDNGQMIFLNFGEEDRMYGYYASKVINHRELVTEYLEGRREAPSGVSNATHEIVVKSFEVETRDLVPVERDAITETQVPDAISPQEYRRRAQQGIVDPDVVVNRGVLKVDLADPRQYGLTSARYTPIFQKYIKGTFRVQSLWIKNLPTPVLKLIRNYPVAFGKVRRLKINKKILAGGGLSGYENQEGDEILHITDFRKITDALAVGVTTEDFAPMTLAHSRHVKMIPSEPIGHYDWHEHTKYLVKFNLNEPAEWYPEELVSEDLKESFYTQAKASSKPVSAIVGREGDKLLVERPDGTVDKVDQYQIFWNELEQGKHQLHPRELEAVLFHMHRDDDHMGNRIHLTTDDPFPIQLAHAPPCPGTYFATAIDFHGGAHPCKVSLTDGDSIQCLVPYAYDEVTHSGRYDLLPFLPDVMELVMSYSGKVPEGRKAVRGGYEGGNKFYHAVASHNGVWIPGKAGPQFNGAYIGHEGKAIWVGNCYILCWK